MDAVRNGRRDTPLTTQALDILDFHEHLTTYNSGSIGLACEKTSNNGFCGATNVDNVVRAPMQSIKVSQPMELGDGYHGATTCDRSGEPVHTGNVRSLHLVGRSRAYTQSTCRNVSSRICERSNLAAWRSGENPHRPRWEL